MNLKQKDLILRKSDNQPYYNKSNKIFNKGFNQPVYLSPFFDFKNL